MKLKPHLGNHRGDQPSHQVDRNGEASTMMRTDVEENQGEIMLGRVMIPQSS
jgi:hypothetical protein